MTTLPYSLGPTSDWDPQGYEDEELEDELMKAGMTVKDEDEDEDEDDEEIEEELEIDDEDEDEEEDEDEDDDDDDYEEVGVDPIAALDDLADQVNREERETLRFKEFDE